MSALPALLSMMLEPEPEPVVAVAVVLAVVAAPEPEVKFEAGVSKPPVHVRYRCEPLPGHRPVPLPKVREHHCRWIVGDDGSNTFCGANKGVRDDGEPSPYCPAHQGYAFRSKQMPGAQYIKSTLRWATR